ncbi:protein-disulfide reductase DsbD [Campylobacter ureolyticus]|uniref:Thiol:disulfide interchange protein DsbD n=2 Tax=Campylobacter ureolyticus TaxID=827 RepID=A0AAE7E9N0_9BACT|nr:protein-disulfide reductase DsbD [Campylobacter ureolyticus]MCR8684590.1 protein-disulfide reductase DsbD [Campylobacter ureolyticus]QKF84120.1 thiol:disulfide interchange protein DsbD [Campylobacter ureolyticus]QQY35735.1 protein-disulfide reductase DsbD [Campylobacter ureolyticus]SUX24017.1 thiol:disulfide interchange protein DsbD [Campylobacter ureolyticus]
MIRNIFLFILMICFLNAEPVNVSEAFKINEKAHPSGISFDIAIDKSVYLYEDELKVFLGSENITKILNLPESKKHKEYLIYDKNFTLFIPTNLILNTSNEKIITLKFLGCAYDGYCYNPQNLKFNLSKTENGFKISKIKDKKVSNNNTNYENKISSDIKNNNFFITIITFFGYGLLLALTPCVFPMIPILSSIIVSKCKNSKNDNKKAFLISFIYVFAMSLAYSIAGILATYFGSSVQGFLQIPWVIILFSLIFIVLAFSMFGFYELQLPASLQSKISKKSESKNGLIGVFIMGFLSALIVGPCVAAPLAGALVYIAQSGNLLLGGSALFIMSFGMGMPLLLIGLGANKFLPKPGYWMNEISKIFGFIMLFMAVWMLSRLISSNLSLLLYGVIGIFFGVSLFPVKKDSVTFKKFKFGFSLAIIIYSVVLIIGFASGSNSLINPLNNTFKSQLKENLNFKKVSNLNELKEVVRGSKKPVLIDFWATWCVNCKELDDTLNSAEISEILSNFELIKVDVTKNSKDDLELMKEFQIYGPPALIFFKNGKELQKYKVIGDIKKIELTKNLNEILNL